MADANCYIVCTHYAYYMDCHTENNIHNQVFRAKTAWSTMSVKKRWCTGLRWKSVSHCNSCCVRHNWSKRPAGTYTAHWSRITDDSDIFENVGLVVSAWSGLLWYCIPFEATWYLMTTSLSQGHWPVWWHGKFSSRAMQSLRLHSVLFV